MSETTASLRRLIAGAGDLQSVVRTMKAIAASSVGQYERAVRALAAYDRAVTLGLGACFRAERPGSPTSESQPHPVSGMVSAVVFGSDQGLVGQFNDVIADHAVAMLRTVSTRPDVWAVGERVYARLADAGVIPIGLLAVPKSVKGITPLVGQILVEYEARHGQDVDAALHLFYNALTFGAGYEPRSQRLLPPDDRWQQSVAHSPWPTKNDAEIFGVQRATLRALISEYLFVSLFRASATSLACENATRLAAMQRADKNIEELLVALTSRFHQVRQNGIDAELFDVIAGFEALAGVPRGTGEREK